MNKLITKILAVAMIALATATAQAQIGSQLKVVGKAADLKLLNANDTNTYALITGWTTPGDGGYEWYRYTPSSALATNYGVITLTTVTSAQWKRLPIYTGGKSPRTQTLTAASNILAEASTVLVAGSGGAVALTSIPTLPIATVGQEITIVGTSDSNTIALSEDVSGALVGSSLILGATNRTLGLNDTIRLKYVGTNWVELSFVNN